MSEVNISQHYRAFRDGKDILEIYQKGVKIWPKVLSASDPAADPARNIIIPHFDLTLTKGKVETFAPRVSMFRAGSYGEPFSSAYPPYGYPELWCGFRVGKITGKTGRVNFRFGVIKMPDWDADTDTASDKHCSFPFDFQDVLEGTFYDKKVGSTPGWDMGFTFPPNIEFYSGGEVEGATDVLLDHVTFKFVW